MKRIIRQAVIEEADYIDDFDKLPAYTHVKVECGFGSKRDTDVYEFHFHDKSLEKVLKFIEKRLTGGRKLKDCLTSTLSGYLVNEHEDPPTT